MTHIQRLLFLVVFIVICLRHEESTAQFVQQGTKLIGTGAVGKAGQGVGVSLSSDGNTAIVSGFYDNSNAGAAWVFTRGGGVWSEQGNKLVGTGAVGNALQGAVALSGDGNTALVGGINDNGGVGAGWVFTRSGGVWSQQAKLVGTGGVGGSAQGSFVAISLDGNTALIGGHRDNGDVGAAWVFTRSGVVWSQQGNKLVGTGAIGSPVNQGVMVSLSSEGNTAIVGGYNDNGGVGAAWVFTRSGGVWSQQGSKLVGTGTQGGRVYQGRGVSLSSDGNTALVSGPGDNGYVGATWVFTRSSGVWSQQGNKLVGTGAVLYPLQGQQVSLSGDGNTAIVGGPGDNSHVGAAWVFTRSGGVWSQLGNKLVGTGAVGSLGEQGIAVSLSSDGNTAMVGGYLDNDTTGAAWVYVKPTSTPSEPILVEPGKGGLTGGLVTFKWRIPVGFGGRYWFELATDSLFAFKVVDSTLTDTVHQVNILTGANTYWWRVCAWNYLGWGEFSNAWNFTAIRAPDKVMLNLPQDRSTVPSANVRIDWFKTSPSVDRYWYEIASDSLFTFKILDSLVTDTSHIFPSLTSGTYWWKVRGHNPAGWGLFSDVWRFTVTATDVHDGNPVPKEFALCQNHPNPFNPSTTIEYALPRGSYVVLKVFDMLGREVATAVDEREEAGYKSVHFDAGGLSSGVYFYRLQAGGFVQTKRLLLIR
jgi:hypothetical protein